MIVQIVQTLFGPVFQGPQMQTGLGEGLGDGENQFAELMESADESQLQDAPAVLETQILPTDAGAMPEPSAFSLSPIANPQNVVLGMPSADLVLLSARFALPTEGQSEGAATGEAPTIGTEKSPQLSFAASVGSAPVTLPGDIELMGEVAPHPLQNVAAKGAGGLMDAAKTLGTASPAQASFVAAQPMPSLQPAAEPIAAPLPLGTGDSDQPAVPGNAAVDSALAQLAKGPQPSAAASALIYAGYGQSAQTDDSVMPNPPQEGVPSRDWPASEAAPAVQKPLLPDGPLQFAPSLFAAQEMRSKVAGRFVPPDMPEAPQSAAGSSAVSAILAAPAFTSQMATNMVGADDAGLEGESSQSPILLGADGPLTAQSGSDGRLGFAATFSSSAIPAAGVSQPAAAISAQIMPLVQAAQSGPVELVLSPAELGQLRFEILQRGDQVQIVLSAERPETMDLLRRNGDQLLADFRNAGFAGASLDFGQWGTGQDGKTHQSADAQPDGASPNIAATVASANVFARPLSYLDPTRSLNLRL